MSKMTDQEYRDLCEQVMRQAREDPAMARAYGIPTGVVYPTLPKNGDPNPNHVQIADRRWLTPAGKVVVGYPWDDGVTPADDPWLPTIGG
jgi:hypothetical protein